MCTKYKESMQTFDTSQNCIKNYIIPFYIYKKYMPLTMYTEDAERAVRFFLVLELFIF